MVTSNNILPSAGAWPRQLFRWLWHSPTANTWLSFLTRSLSLVLVIPLVLRQFDAPQAALWFVFSSALAVQGLLNFGFAPSFARLLAYARAGGEVEDMADLQHGNSISTTAGVNWRSVARLLATMHRVFVWLGLASAALMATVGTGAMLKPLAAAGNSVPGWAAWGVVVLVSSLSLGGSLYGVFLLGMNHVTLLRRAEAVTGLAGILSSFLVLLLGGNVLALVIANQFWVVAGIVLNAWLCRRVEAGRFARLEPAPWEPTVFRLVWDSAWKNGITSVMTAGLVQVTGLLQAQVDNPAQTATYLFTLRLIGMLSQVAQAPFLSKIPELARLRAGGKLDEQTRLLRRGMRLSHWVLVLGLVSFPLVAPWALAMVRSRSVAFDPLLWAIFAANTFFERYSAMLHQVRNLTNQPAEHWGMLGYFTVNVGTLLLTHRAWGMYAFPAAMLAAQLLFAVWYAARVAYRVLGVRPFVFERALALPPFGLLVLVNAWFVLQSRR